MKKLATVVAGLAMLAGTLALAEPARSATSGPPDVVVIMLDDISEGYLDAMPHLSNLIVDAGTLYPNGVAPTALCCPSRASFLTGRYAHTTDVYGNAAGSGHGGWASFQASESDTLATALDAQGYRTMLIGKYLNGYGKAPAGYTPAGWDRFVAFDDIGYSNWSTNGTEIATYGSSNADYSTDVLADKAATYVANTKADTPLFLYWSPYAAHKPYQPAARHLDTWHTEPLYGALNLGGSDKPQFIRDKNTLSPYDLQLDQQRKHELLMSADEGFQQIYQALGDRASNTLFILMSDNGFLLGDHRMSSKDAPYQHATGILTAARWDGVIAAGATDTRITPQIDLTEAIGSATGSALVTEGRNFLTQGRAGVVLEQMDSTDSLGGNGGNLDLYHPAYCGWRTARWMFVRWATGEEELYDYDTDPDETTNVVTTETAQADSMRDKAITNCVPLPPGFSW